VFEGRDGAGKGGTIKAITERVSPRVFRVVALSALTERERRRLRQRDIAHLPGAGGRDLTELYNRAGVERVKGFAPSTDEALADGAAHGASDHRLRVVLKYWLEVKRSSRRDDCSHRRTQDLEAVADGPAVLRPLHDYSVHGTTCSKRPTRHSPGCGEFDDKRRARLNVKARLLRQIPYEDLRKEGEAAEAAGSARLSRPGLSAFVPELTCRVSAQIQTE
jgi:polyphosphate kinase 2 (PPK2 family)